MRIVAPVLFGLAVCLLGAGCGGGSEPQVHSVGEAYANLNAIKNAYFKATRDLHRPPQSFDELKPILSKAGDVDKIMRSPDDGLDYKIVWGVDVMNVQAVDGKYPVLAYEQHGKDGKRFVLEAKLVKQMTDDEFRQAVFPPNYRP